MKKMVILISVAVMTAVVSAAVDQIIWDMEFSLLNASLGFVLGGIMVLLSGGNEEYQRDEV